MFTFTIDSYEVVYHIPNILRNILCNILRNILCVAGELELDQVLHARARVNGIIRER